MHFSSNRVDTESQRNPVFSQRNRQDTIERISNKQDRKAKGSVERSDQKRNLDLINELKQMNTSKHRSRDAATKQTNKAATSTGKLVRSSE